MYILSWLNILCTSPAK